MLEILLEFFFEGLADASGSPKIPKAVRYILFSFLCCIPITIGILCCFSSYKATGVIGLIACIIITIFLVGVWGYGLLKIGKHK